MTDSTISDLLATGGADAPALSSPGGVPLTYGALRALVAAVRASLNAHGVGRNDRAAIVLDNGPELAAAFLCVAASATTAPLNPAYRTEEFEFYLSDLRARVLIVDASSDSPAIEVARGRGIPVVRLEPTPQKGAGSFALHFPGERVTGAHGAPGAAQPDDIAIVLHTSGTTSRPKIVPLAHRKLAASARNICATTRFSAADRGLNVMPLFHIHGLIAGLLAPLSVGGEVCCTPGFNALKFFPWMGQMRPTWYTAVPSMHQAILARAGGNAAIIAASPLRFIRSCSSPLAPQLFHELESTFRAPVIEAYGMTEAAHQMTSNPLPPGARKPGTVGMAMGTEVAVIDSEGNPLDPGVPGEIAVRGANVMDGYENNAQANRDAFVNGWFRTGDQGVIDPDGYVTITGRLKEIINRGGEKISPREVDEVLLDHAAVAQCVTFAMPHAQLGEAVAAAVVLRQGAAATAEELREFAAARLARFKVPAEIHILAEIPKGPTGKLRRIGLAKVLGLA